MLEKRLGIPSKKGYYTSTVSKTEFRYDSMTELAVMMILDGKGSNWIKNTQLRIPYIFAGKNRNYIPDFIITKPDNSRLILEIKGSNDRPELQFKINAALEFCKGKNTEYKVIPWEQVKKQIDWSTVQEYHKTHEKMAFKVKDLYRENELSKTPGGFTVVVTEHSGRQLVYDKVKNPAAYIKKLLKNPEVKDAYVKEE